MTTNINYTLPSGKKAVITVAPSKSWDGSYYASTSATVEGGNWQSGGRIKPAGLPAWAVSSIGKLPLTAEVDAQVQAAEESINAAYADHNAAAAAHIAELEAVSAHSRMIARRMAY
jgi:hypothetical protein